MSKKNTGFLPMKTNWFDKLFIGVISFIALQLLWMRFIETFLSINFSISLGIFLLIYIILKG